MIKYAKKSCLHLNKTDWLVLHYTNILYLISVAKEIIVRAESRVPRNPSENNLKDPRLFPDHFPSCSNNICSSLLPERISYNTLSQLLQRTQWSARALWHGTCNFRYRLHFTKCYLEFSLKQRTQPLIGKPGLLLVYNRGLHSRFSAPFSW